MGWLWVTGMNAEFLGLTGAAAAYAASQLHAINCGIDRLEGPPWLRWGKQFLARTIFGVLFSLILAGIGGAMDQPAMEGWWQAAWLPAVIGALYGDGQRKAHEAGEKARREAEIATREALKQLEKVNL